MELPIIALLIVTIILILWGWYNEHVEHEKKIKLGTEVLRSYKVVLQQAEKYSNELKTEIAVSDSLRISLLTMQEELIRVKNER